MEESRRLSTQEIIARAQSLDFQPGDRVRTVFEDAQTGTIVAPSAFWAEECKEGIHIPVHFDGHQSPVLLCKAYLRKMTLTERLAQES